MIKFHERKCNNEIAELSIQFSEVDNNPQLKAIALAAGHFFMKIQESLDLSKNKISDIRSAKQEKALAND